MHFFTFIATIGLVLLQGAVVESANTANKALYDCPDFNTDSSTLYAMYNETSTSHIFTTNLTYIGILDKQGWVNQGPLGREFIGDNPLPCTVPLYELWRGVPRIQYLTTNETERDVLHNTLGFTSVIKSRVFFDARCGGIPLYKYMKNLDWIYTTDKAVGDRSVASGYADQGTAFYLIPNEPTV